MVSRVMMRSSGRLTGGRPRSSLKSKKRKRNFRIRKNVRSLASLPGQLLAAVHRGATAPSPGRGPRRGVRGGRVLVAVRGAGASDREVDAFTTAIEEAG